ncbi:MAG: hypothetical protein WC947_05930 [Elusimicrobiota bacterium]
MLKKFLLFIFAVLLFGCATTRFIVLRDVPKNPVVTVIPATMDKKDLEVADEVTQALIENRVKVIERPAMITQTTKANVKQTGWNPDTGVLGAVTGSGVKGESVSQIGDIVEVYSKTTADYIFVAQYPNRLKIVKRDSNEILFSDYINSDERGNACADIGVILVNLGIIPEKIMGKK